VDNAVETMIKNESGKQFIPFKYVENIFIRILSQVIFGEIMNFNDPRIEQIQKSFESIQVNAMKVYITEYFPALKLFINPLKNKEIGIRTTQLFNDWFNKRKSIVDQMGNIFECFTDLNILLRNNLCDDTENDYLDDNQLFGNLNVVYFGKIFIEKKQKCYF
jgi:hypothetical protein